jgi:hypothetical protein
VLWFLARLLNCTDCSSSSNITLIHTRVRLRHQNKQF